MEVKEFCLFRNLDLVEPDVQATSGVREEFAFLNLFLIYRILIYALPLMSCKKISFL